MIPMVTKAMAPEYTLIALAATAPMAIASRVSLANQELSSEVKARSGSPTARVRW